MCVCVCACLRACVRASVGCDINYGAWDVNSTNVSTLISNKIHKRFAAKLDDAEHMYILAIFSHQSAGLLLINDPLTSGSKALFH